MNRMGMTIEHGHYGFILLIIFIMLYNQNGRMFVMMFPLISSVNHYKNHFKKHIVCFQMEGF